MFEDEIKDMLKSGLRDLKQQLEEVNENKEQLKGAVSYIENLKSVILDSGFKEAQVAEICLIVIDGLAKNLTIDTSNSFYDIDIPKQLIMVEAINEGIVTEYCKILKFYYDELSKLGFYEKQIFKLMRKMLETDK